jgi:hypothetical protein
MVLTLWDVGGVDMHARPVGGTAFPIFNSKGMLKLGHRKVCARTLPTAPGPSSLGACAYVCAQLYLWKNVEGDPAEATTTPHKRWKARGMDRVEKARQRSAQ